jgi:hypothetical protein
MNSSQSSGIKAVPSPEFRANEEIVWTGRPFKKAFRRRNIEWMIIDFLNIVSLVTAFFLLVYLLSKEINFENSFKLGASLFVFFLIIMISQISTLNKHLRKASTLTYWITNQRIIYYPGEKKDEFKYFEFVNIKSAMLKKSKTDNENKVGTIKVFTDVYDQGLESDFEFFIESVPSAEEVNKIISSFCRRD